MQACALVGASDFNAGHFFSLYDSGVFSYVIAVDGGFAHLDASCCVPDMVVGDFDSLGYVPKVGRVMRAPTDKDYSDMELAFRRAAAKRFDALYVYGGLGGRLDHTLANIQLCAKVCEQDKEVTAVGMDAAVSFISGPGCIRLAAVDSGTVSVFSLSVLSRGVFEQGLKWELENAEIRCGSSRGLSNELCGKAAQIGLEEGTLAVFYPVACGGSPKPC